MEQLNQSTSNIKHTANQPTAPSNAIHTSAKVITTPAEIADKYTFVRELGHGAQGYVYEAIRRSDNLKVAIKQLRIDSVQTWKSYDLFQRESEVLASLNVEGVAHLYESMTFLDIAHPAAYIVQEFIEGRSIDAMLKAGARLSHTRILEIAVKLISLLEKLHSHNPPVVHRDIKPSNVMLSPKADGSFELYLIDFGAVANPQLQSGGSTVAGTYGYMAPEQLMGKPSPASDIYALAAMLASLLSGVEPADMQIADFRLVIEPHLQMLPNCVVSTLRQMLTPNAANRLVDYTILKERFELYASNRFESSTSDSVQSSDLTTELAKVNTFGQPGNIELWCMLPEITPRDVSSFEHLFKPTFSLATDSSIVENLKKTARSKSNKQLAVAISIGAFIFFFCALAIFSGALLPSIISIIALTAGSICVIIAYRSEIDSTNPICYAPPSTDTSSHTNSTGKRRKKINNNITFDVIHDLLQNGQKAIATVVSVEYVSLNQDLIETYTKTLVPDKNLQITNPSSNRDKYHYYNNEDSVIYGDDLTINVHNGGSSISMSAINKEFYYFHGLPSFKVRYKFNPVDDSNPDDLFHEIIVHHDVVKSLKPGDVLPILYKVDPNDGSKVSSIPFPLPAININSYREIVADNETEY